MIQILLILHLLVQLVYNYCQVNIETEDVICATVMSLIEKGQSEEDITKCLWLIRYEHLTPEYLCNVSLSQPIMKKEPQKSYI